MAVAGDLRDPAGILDHPAVRGHLPGDEPIRLLLCGILHYLTDEEHPAALVAALSRALPPGSCVFIHHLLNGEDPATGGLPSAMRRALGPVQFRTRAQIRELFAGLEQAPPGLMLVPRGRPAPEAPGEPDWPVLRLARAGLARKPSPRLSSRQLPA